jgi:hypothetical protein
VADNVLYISNRSHIFAIAAPDGEADSDGEDGESAAAAKAD